MKDVNQVVDNTLDSLNKARTARPVAGASRKGNNPVLFLIGNSTMRTGTLGNGNNGQWGWGYYAGDYFDSNRITVENHALGGTSSRTFYNRLWPDVIKGVQAGDWVIIELGHNDNGPYDSGRARASIPGIGKDSLNVTIKETGAQETVYTYGEYMRRFINDVKAKGAHPILFSLTPRNAWADKDSTIITRVNKTFGLWAKQVAEEQNVPFIDLNDISARKFEKFGKNKVKYMFYIDRIHTSAFGAKVNAESAADGIRACEGLELAKYLKPVEKDEATGSSRKEGRPVLFTIGDSTVKNKDNDKNGMWGWGSVIADEFDLNKISVENCAMAGRSARTFLDEGRWDKGKNKVKYMFYIDRIHTSAFGAKVNAESAADGIRACEGLELAKYLKPVEKDEATGSSRKEGRPVLFTIGDSTVKNKDNDKNGMWGWGSVIADEFDLNKISVENCAMAGRSARTFLDEGRWDKVYHALQPGDFVLIQFGHNDAGEINTGKARAELPGSGEESKVFLMEKTGKYQVIYTFGWYLRKFIMDVQEKGAIPIVLSHTPRNKWKDGKIERNTASFGKWTHEAAEATGAYFIDLNKISADKLEKKGIKKAADYYNNDHTHTSLKGAHMNAKSIADGLKMADCPLKQYLK